LLRGADRETLLAFKKKRLTPAAQTACVSEFLRQNQSIHEILRSINPKGVVINNYSDFVNAFTAHATLMVKGFIPRPRDGQEYGQHKFVGTHYMETDDKNKVRFASQVVDSRVYNSRGMIVYARVEPNRYTTQIEQNGKVNQKTIFSARISGTNRVSESVLMGDSLTDIAPKSTFVMVTRGKWDDTDSFSLSQFLLTLCGMISERERVGSIQSHTKMLCTAMAALILGEDEEHEDIDPDEAMEIVLSDPTATLTMVEQSMFRLAFECGNRLNDKHVKTRFEEKAAELLDQCDDDVGFDDEDEPPTKKTKLDQEEDVGATVTNVVNNGGFQEWKPE
jgi:hypothetical protein